MEVLKADKTISDLEIEIREERISPVEYIRFLKRTDLGSQYPKERFAGRMGFGVLRLYIIA